MGTTVSVDCDGCGKDLTVTEKPAYRLRVSCEPVPRTGKAGPGNTKTYPLIGEDQIYCSLKCLRQTMIEIDRAQREAVE